jgi:asparagine synthase (glutamine-hydrolysing)
MLERIRHRGPDDRGVWTQDEMGLGLVRLSIIDLSERGHQPFRTADGMGVIAYNGEVYNFQELRKELNEQGVQFESSSDTEVALYALHTWGPEKAVPRFDGMFAFAYFDLRNRTLWLSRDRTGIKPLYTAHVDGTIAFASEMKALFEHPGIPCRPDVHSLTTMVIHQRLDGKWTPFDNVESVIPGTVVKITRGREEEIVYYDLLRDLDVERLIKAQSVPFEVLRAQFEDLLAKSIQMHLISDAPLAAMLSGGLDSSLMLAIGRQHKKDIVAYVADVKGTEISEARKAQRVADHLGIELRSVEVGAREFLRLWPVVVYQNDQPNHFAQNVPFTAVASAARRDGFKVLLSGEGSDELFGGYPWFVETYKMWRLRRLHSLLVPDIAPLRILGRWMGRLAPLDLKALAHTPFSHLSKWEKVDAETRALLVLDGERRHTRENALFQKLEKVEPIEERAFLAHSFEDHYIHLRTLLACNDKMGMLQSVEARVPYLETNLIDFAMHLPCSAKYFKGMTKRIVKKSAENKLPLDIVHAPKIGFAITHNLWKGTEVLLKGGVVCELFKWGPAELQAASRARLEEPWFAFHIVSVELWARTYFRGESPAELGERLLAIHGNGGKASGITVH